MHIYFNIRKTSSLNKKKINMHACVINIHRTTLNMHKMVLLQMVSHSLLLLTKLGKMRDISFDKLYVGDSTNETVGRRRIPCLCVLGKPYYLSARSSKLFRVNSSLVEIFLFYFYPETNVLTVFSVIRVGSQFNGLVCRLIVQHFENLVVVVISVRNNSYSVPLKADKDNVTVARIAK